MNFAQQMRNLTNNALEQEQYKKQAADEHIFVQNIIRHEAEAGNHKVEISIDNKIATYLYHLIKEDGLDISPIPSWMPNDKQTRYLIIW